jgi:hypothetical protein
MTNARFYFVCVIAGEVLCSRCDGRGSCCVCMSRSSSSAPKGDGDSVCDTAISEFGGDGVYGAVELDSYRLVVAAG